MMYYIIYTIILLKCVGDRKPQVAILVRSIVSGDVSNCSYRLTVHTVTRLRLSSA